MKMNLKMQLMFLLLMSAICVKGQLNYQKGYVVTLQKDTIFGLIKDRGEIVNAKMCQFKKERKADEVSYTPNEIVAYKFFDGKAYRSMEVFQNNKYQLAFVEVLIEGKVNLYHFWHKSVMNYFIEKENGKTIGLLNELFTLEKPSEDFYSPSKYQTFQIETYKDSLESIFKDYPALKQKIEEVDYETKPLMNLTKEYLKNTCSDEQCIKYEKDLNVSKPTFGFFTGLQLSSMKFLSSPIKSNISSTIPVGAFANIPMPKLTENLSFQAELIYSQVNVNQGFNNLPFLYSDINIKYNKIAIPLSLKYKFPLGKLSPSIGVGKEFAMQFNSTANIIPVDQAFADTLIVIEQNYRRKGFYVHNTQKGGWFVDLGLDYKLTPAFSVFGNLRFQSNLNLVIEEKNYNNNLFYVAEERNLLRSLHSNIFRSNCATLYLGIRF